MKKRSEVDRRKSDRRKVNDSPHKGPQRRSGSGRRTVDDRRKDQKT